MNCANCGTMIPDGQNVCPNCGAPVQMNQFDQMQPQQPMGGYQQPVQPQQPMGGYQQPVQPQQPMGGYQQPVQPMGGYYQPRSNTMVGGGFGAYMQSLAGNVMNIVKLIGALILFISPLLPWIKVNSWLISESGNLFKMGGFDIVVALMLMIIGAVLVCWDIADFIPALGNVKMKLAGVAYFELILVGVALLFVIIGTFYLGDINGSDLKEMKEWGIPITRTVGVFFGYIGVIAAATPRVMKMLGK